MNQSNDTSEIYAALAAAQGEIQNPTKDKTANVPTKSGGAYSYAYADIADVLSTVRPVLSKHGLAVVQMTMIDQHNMMLRTRITHKSGQFVESDYPVCQIGGDHRVMGAALTYARRYALCPMLGIAADQDTDGEAAAEAPRRQERSGPPPAPQRTVPARPSDAALAYAAEAETEIMNADDSGELLRWWNSETSKQRRRDVNVPPDMLAALKEQVMARAGELGHRGMNGQH